MTAGDGPRGIPPDDRPAPPGTSGASPAGAQEHSPQEAAAGGQGADQAGAAARASGGAAPRAEVPTVTLRHVAKAFGAVRAVIDGTIDLYAGEAHALLGENGAGKSTMVKILAGVHEPDEGEVLLDGHPVTLASPAAARDAGIAVIYQEPTLFPDLSVAENIFMGRQPLVARAHRPAPDAGHRRRSVRPPRRPPRPGPDLPRPVHRRPAAGRDRQGAVPGGQGHRDGRADRRAVRRRGGPAVRGRAHAAGRRVGRAVHLAPAGRGVRDLPAGHRHARRAARADQRARGDDHRRPGPRNGRPADGGADRGGAQRPRRHDPDRRAAHP